jgi:N,N'-diacetyllegionaminate synthase
MYLIAEIGQAHEGSLGIAHSYIDALAATGVDAVKFQTHIAEAESSIHEPFRVKFSYEDDTRYDYWKRMEFNAEQWAGLKAHCEDKGMEFISSPFSIAAVELLERIGVKKYKIGSGEVSNLLMLNRIALTGKDMLLSSGMSDWDELDTAVAFLKPFGNKLTVLQCTTAYPTAPEQWGLQLIPELKERYKLPVGFSDHSGEITAGIAAFALGASVLEFHVVFDKRMFGPDTLASLTIDQCSQIVRSVRDLERALKASISKGDQVALQPLRDMFGKSLALNRSLPAGYSICLEDLEAKKPKGHGIAASDYQHVIGRTLRVSKQAWDFLRQEDLM